MGLRAAYTLPLVMVGALLLAGCARDDEASMRARLDPWFSLGETLAFASMGGCAAGAFRVRTSEIASSVAVERSVQDMLIALPRRGVAAVDDPELTPDQAMVDAANAQRSLGMGMRRAALEARPCMKGPIEAEFLRLLQRPDAVLAFEAGEGSVMLLDRANRVLVVAMGERA